MGAALTQRGAGDYVKKFGVPLVGMRVFIRTRQILNGWEDEFKDLYARVPGA